MPKTGSFLRRSNTGCADIHHSLTVRFLDETEQLTVTFQKSSKGQEIIDHVCNTLNLVERDYFGLRYVDSDKQRHWLDGTRNAYLQLKDVKPLLLCFRVKFYPSDPSKLKEEITRYYLYLQLVRDLHHGRLLCNQTEANQLAAYIAQDELGDYDDQEMQQDYIKQVKMLPKQCQKQEAAIEGLHKELAGKVPSVVEQEFLDMASKLDTYGVDPHPVKDLAGVQKYLGITYHGIVTFQGNTKISLFTWPNISKLDFEGKHFIVHVNESEANSTPSGTVNKIKKRPHHFKCSSAKSCKHLWKCAVEQQYFFTLQSSASAPKVSAGRRFLRRGSSFRFSGHTENEAFAESNSIARDEPKFTRSASNPSLMFRGNTSYGSNTLPAGFKPSMMLDTSADISDRLNSTTLSEGISNDISVECIREEEPTSDSPTSDLPGEAPLNDGQEVTEPVISLAAVDVSRAELFDKTSNEQIEEVKIETKKIGEGLVIKNENGLESIGKVATPSRASSVGNGGKAVSKQEIGKNNVLRNVAIFLLVATLVVFLFLFLVYETKADVPLISGVREFPEIQHFEKNYYRPMRKAILG